jgi:hypothetical protein
MARAVLYAVLYAVFENVWLGQTDRRNWATKTPATSDLTKWLEVRSDLLRDELEEQQQQALCQMQPLAMRSSLCLAALQKMEV